MRKPLKPSRPPYLDGIKTFVKAEPEENEPKAEPEENEPKPEPEENDPKPEPEENEPKPEPEDHESNKTIGPALITVKKEQPL